MEAPDRIYLQEPIKVRTEKKYANDVEYVLKDAFIEKAKNWFIEHTNISQEIETNEDGEPLADSYIKYAKARLDAANEIFENFKKYMIGE